MKHILLSILILFCSFGLFSQENAGNSTIQTALKVKALQEKKMDYHKKTGGETDGYRIKIHFSADRSKGKEIQSRFLSKYSDVPTYEEYQQPNWVIIVGDFKTKLEAYEMLKKVKENFPYAFIVKSRVRPMRLN